MCDVMEPMSKKMRLSTPNYSQVVRKTSTEGNISRWWIEIKGEKVLEKVVELSPSKGYLKGAKHSTAVYALGEVVMSTTLHMKVMVHFEHKDKLEQAFAKIAAALDIPSCTATAWDDLVKQLQLSEMKSLHHSFYVNKTACPDLCPNGPFN